MEATLTTKGQLTVPKKIRDQLRLHAGDRLEFILDGSHIIMVPKKTPMSELRGMLGPPVTGVSLEDIEEAIAEGAAGVDRD